jgi:multisubunit Na+/H+ antiporter MnhE subunit
MKKSIAISILSLLAGAVLYYLIFALCAAEFNPFNWHWLVRIAYILFTLDAASNIEKIYINKLKN